jgi:predicted metalloprotease
MKLKRRNSKNVIDRRGGGAGGSSIPGLGGRGGGGGMGFPGMGRGGGGGLPIGGKGGGIGLILVIILFAVCIAPKLFGGGGGLGGDTFSGLGQAQEGTGIDPANDPDLATKLFVNDVTADLEETWAQLFQGSDTPFQEAKLFLFTGGIQTACGRGSSATGPFYCPADSSIYLDMSFFRELDQRFGAPGDFAQAYVIAHEYGHHIQNLLGINAEVQRLSREDPGRANDLSVRLELQADCLAGVWGHTLTSEELGPDEVNEALTAAAAIGDDRIQASTTGRIDPESWTHGSSAQRVQWFQAGFDSGNPDDCDTFNTDI